MIKPEVHHICGMRFRPAVRPDELVDTETSDQGFPHREAFMNDSVQIIRDESRWPPALTILSALFLLAALPGHVTALPVWVSYLTVVAVISPMAAVDAHGGKHFGSASSER